MNPNQCATSEGREHEWADIAIRLTLVAFIAYWSFLLLRPFIVILVWAAILTVTLFPIYVWLKRLLRERSILASALLTAIALVITLGPIGALGTALVENLSTVTTAMSKGTITVPPLPPYVAELPLVGSKLSDFWHNAAANLEQTLTSIAPHLKLAAIKMLEVIGSIGKGGLQFVIAIIIAGFAYSRAPDLQEILTNFAARAAPRIGEGFIDLAGGTVRRIARGVVGISLIQAILFGIGALIADIPLAGLWTFVALILAIIQIGPGLVIVPVIIFAWSSMDTAGAVMLTAYLVPVMFLDSVLKPMVMGQGLPVPMLVIFFGIIGGTIAHGLIGLFVGPIILAMGYELTKAWIATGCASFESCRIG